MSNYRSACIAFLGWFVACFALTAMVRSLVRDRTGIDSTTRPIASETSSPGEMTKTVIDGTEEVCGTDGVHTILPERIQNELITISISPESRVKATCTDQQPRLQQNQWCEFSISIDNAAGITSPLSIESEQMIVDGENDDHLRWLRVEIEPKGKLSGQRQETRKVRIWSRDAGYRAAVLQFNAGQGTQDLGFRSDVLVVFRSEAN